jgi:hypothetical protein
MIFALQPEIREPLLPNQISFSELEQTTVLVSVKPVTVSLGALWGEHLRTVALTNSPRWMKFLEFFCCFCAERSSSSENGSHTAEIEL